MGETDAKQEELPVGMFVCLSSFQSRLMTSSSDSHSGLCFDFYSEDVCFAHEDNTMENIRHNEIMSIFDAYVFIIMKHLSLNHAEITEDDNL